jgi:hypothetical protein
MMKLAKQEKDNAMTRSVLALVAAVGCFGMEPAGAPLLQVRRVYVDRLTGESSVQIRDMLINALQATKLFVITENPDRADATLRGSAEDLIYTDTFQSSEGVDARASLGSGTSSTSRSAGRRGAVSLGVGLNEATKTAERKHEALAAVRLINKDGDVIWSTTQESNGAKFRGASADVAEKVVRQLLADLEKARLPAQQ